MRNPIDLSPKKRVRVDNVENGVFFFEKIFSKEANDQVRMTVPVKRVKDRKKYEFSKNDSDSEDELVSFFPDTPTRYNRMRSQTGIVPMQKIKCSLTPCRFKSIYRTPVSKKTRTPSTPTIYSKGKALFSRGAVPIRLTGRSEERAFIVEFIEHCISQEKGGSLYVCGPPGTGKTAIIVDVMKQQFIDRNITSTSINCMAQDLKNEIDSLIMKNQEILYQLFEWPTLENSKLIIIGVANTLDLTDRFMPGLKIKNAIPKVFTFKPYTLQEISDIIKDRLSSLCEDAPENFIPIFQPAAIELCSRKVASSTGDIRKAFDLIKKAIELLETELYINKKPLSEISPNKLLSPPDTNKYPVFSEKSSELPKVTVEHILRVSNSVFGNSIISQLKNFTLQQKAILCALSVCKKECPNGVLVGKLFDTYTYLCRRDKLLHPLNSLEFTDVIGTLETSTAVNIVNTTISLKTNDIMNKKIGLTVPEMDILTAISDIGLLRRFFQ
ncbi:hypothetical protein PCANB_002722 [Pneumocystis canis]|nr:hypothetical protein PCANB_002722 [Pneumocystis canis]